MDRVLSSLGLPGWFRHAYFEYHAHVRMRFKLAAGLGDPWTRDGGIPQGCPLSMMFIVALYLPWCRYLSRFRLLRRCLALWPAVVGRVYRLLAMVHEGCPGHGPVHLLSASAAEIGFQWDPHALAWVRPGLPLLSNLAGPIQHFKAAVLDAWRNKVAADLCCRQGFRGGPFA